MDILTMLNGLGILLEDRTMGDDIRNNYEVVVAGSSIRNGHLYVTVKANDGTIKHFRLTEV